MTRIERLNPGDDVQFQEFHRCYEAAHDGRWDRPYSAAELRAMFLDDSGFVAQLAVLARGPGGEPVGVGRVELPLRDNLKLVNLELWVLPAHRRAGHGSALLEALIGLARSQGRSTVCAGVCWEEGERYSGNRAFAVAKGFRLDLVDAQRVLELPAVVPEVPPPEGYRLRGWRDSCPPEWVDGYAHLMSIFAQEAPSGELKMETEFYDASRVRAAEEQLAAAGRQEQVSIALAADGTVVGHTQLLFPAAPQKDVFQSGTLVLAAHRGHGLALALKAHAMRAAQDLLAGRSYIHTYNAVSNGPMIAVNERLGYRHVANCGEYLREI